LLRDWCRCNIFLEALLSGLLKCFLFFPHVKLLLSLSVLLNPLVLSWISCYFISSCLGSSLSDYIDVSPIIPGFCINPLDILVVLVYFFLDIPQECWVVFCVMVYYATLHTTYMSRVGVENPLHNVLVVGICGTLLVLCLIQILLYLILHLYIHLDLCVVCCTEVPSYTTRGYIVVAHYYIADAHCFIVVAHFCMVVVLG
jgi:hypothetical protein